MKKSDLATAAFFLALSFGLGISFWLSPDKGFSESENRVLTAAPALSVSNLRDGSFSSSPTSTPFTSPRPSASSVTACRERQTPRSGS